MKITTLLILLAFVVSCKTDDFVNPYDGINNPQEMTEENINLEHDGTFEPDFRTIESSYNTLVGAAIIKNDPQNSFEYRVVKGNASASQLIARVTYDIDGNSGVMPLAVDPDSDWEANKETYIQNIEDWIAAGAKDVFGN